MPVPALLALAAATVWLASGSKRPALGLPLGVGDAAGALVLLAAAWKTTAATGAETGIPVVLLIAMAAGGGTVLLVAWFPRTMAWAPLALLLASATTR